MNVSRGALVLFTIEQVTLLFFNISLYFEKRLIFENNSSLTLFMSRESSKGRILHIIPFDPFRSWGDTHGDHRVHRPKMK